MNSIHPSAKLYRDAIIYNSIIGEKCIIGDFSRIKESVLRGFCSIDRNNFLLSVDVGSRTYTGPWDMIFHSVIGKYCSISYGVTIGPPEHDYTRISTHPFIYDSKFCIFQDDDFVKSEKFAEKLTIGNDVWIGCNSTVLRGVAIGHGAVIAANSIVTKDVPPYAIVAGTPARVIKYRFDDAIINALLDIKWWDWSEERIRLNEVLYKKKKITLEDIYLLK